jgi:hypothetical protein
MEKGNIREYLRINTDADRLRLLSEVASGMYNVPDSGSATMNISIIARY